MRGLGILILIVVFFWLFWPSISRWLKKKAMNKAEDYLRSSMGMPPRDQTKTNTRNSSGRYYKGSNRQNNTTHGSHEPIIPKEYAEDVEFTETKDFSYTSRQESTSQSHTTTYHESQISDAEWTEIKTPRTK